MLSGIARIVWMALAVVVPGTARGDEHRLVEEWRDPQFEQRLFRKVLIIAISDVAETRHLFEDKFLTHLRGKKVDGVPSNEIVPQLDRPQERAAIIAALEEEGVDGAITVRLVPLDEIKEEGWAKEWRGQAGPDIRVRDLIEQTLPLPEKRAKHYGVEVAMWDSTDWQMIWAARTDSYKRRELSDEAASFVQFTMFALWDARLLP